MGKVLYNHEWLSGNPEIKRELQLCTYYIVRSGFLSCLTRNSVSGVLERGPLLGKYLSLLFTQ